LSTIWLNMMAKAELDISTREKILEAARSVFIREGNKGARMQEIADAAGINKAMLHYYFKNKESLFEMVFNDAFSEFIPKIHLIFSSEGTVMEKIERYVELHITLLISKPGLTMFVLNEVHQNPDRFFNSFFGKMPGEPPFVYFLNQVEQEMEAGKICKMNARELWMNIMGMTIFPFVAAPMLKKLLLMEDVVFDEIILQRKKTIINFIKQAIVLPEEK